MKYSKKEGEEMNLTKNQIDCMKHCISSPNRNWFATDENSRDGKDFEELVKLELATKQKGPSWADGETIYRLTEKGKKMIQKNLKRKVKK